MNTIDKLLIIGLGLFICINISWETPMPLLGFIPVLYAIISLVIKDFDSNG